MESGLEPRAGLPRLVRLRWLAFLGQCVLVWLARASMSTTVLAASSGIVLLTGLSNAALELVRRRAAWASSSRVVGTVLTLDTLLLTGLLGFNGGATNPFSVMYIVYISLAAVVLGARWTTFIAALSVSAYAALFLLPVEGSPAHHHGPQHHGQGAAFTNHVRGMWLAFTLAATLVAYFVRAIAATIAKQRDEIEALRDSAARTARLASLSTLSAGAAHELGSPLGTIAVAAREIELAGAARPDAQPIVEDAQLVLAEVERCRRILMLMSGRATNAADAVTVPLAELPGLLAARVDSRRAESLDVTIAPEVGALVVPKERTLQALTALTQNALTASAERGRVSVAATSQAKTLTLTVKDLGAGMGPDVLAHAGEPFFTTREPGQGLGLGLFLVRAFADSLGGSFRLESRVGLGTTATLTIPVTDGRVGAPS
jgi:two-component system sensor histidine kinase RegB